MYTLAVGRDFVATHYLTVPDPGPEGEPHEHDYRVEVCFSGPRLDDHGYLVDIDAVDDALDDLLVRYDGVLLNDLPEFGDANPSVERFARHLGDGLVERTPTGTPTGLTVRLWEGPDAWAAYERDC